MTAQARLRELRELLAKATPGPWVDQGSNIWHETFPGEGGPCPQPPEGEQHGEFDRCEDAALVVALVNDAEALLECAELVANAELEGEPDWMNRARAALAKIGGSE